MSPLDEAIARIEAQWPDHYWQVAKSRLSENEPLYAIQIYDPGDTDNPIVEVEGDSLMECVRRAEELYEAEVGEE